ncbi:Protein argonaute-2 [Thelohanellus kitauei]|uniref:Protein argonaute-2 n=1 Tax=Thelohanellus kitauei TaxID=669202 RepID=A0A0C2JAU6_THEKT|nr:Protein argonaute-2 [Thelohanellus kitauei]
MYSICVEPPEIKVERAEKQWIQELIEDLRKKNNHPHGNAIISDNSRTIYCSKMIKDLEDFSFNKSLKTVGKQFSHKFTVKFVKCIKISEMQRKEDHRVLNQALETIFKFCSPEYIEIRRNMYPLFSQRGNDNNYFKILCGLRERVVFTDPKAIYINADLGYAAVIPHSSLIDVVKNLLPRGKNLETLKSERPQIIEEISSKLKGIEATIEHLKYGKKIIKILNKSANDHVFEYEIEDKNHKTSITDYFMKKYQRKLRFPNYPLVQVAPASKDIYMPMELLKIDKWQPVRGNPQIATTEIIKVATEGGCSGRYGDTDRLVNDKFDRINNVLEGFGIVVERTMTHVDDSVLRVPTIQFNSRTITPENGAFVGNFGQFYHSAEIVHLHILDITQKNLSGPLHQLLADVAKQRGLYIKRVSTHALEFNVSDAIRYLRASLPKDCDFCLIIIPQSASDQSYGAIKAVMDIEKGIVSQVVRDRHFEPTVKPNSLRNVFYNIILKTNAKAGGINFYAHLTTSLSQCLTNGSQTMVMGVDVNHSMGGSADESAVSMASVVSSLDDKFTKYTNQVCVNQRGCDIVECFEKIMTEALERYKLVNKQYPKRVIVFRDGLSEGQHLHSRVREVESILSALKKTRDGRPLLTFLCVQKRHSTRFYNVSGQQVYDCPPGLLVKDSKICDDKMFYLLSHKAIKGTAKSSQYKIIYNDNKISLDDLANFSFILCHNYARCLRSVSIPAPTYYAHLCALRSNFHRGFVDR